MTGFHDPHLCARFVAHFCQLYREYEKKGGAYKLTPLGAWATARPQALLELFQEVKLQRHSRFADLGCGDGVAVCCAALFCRAVGIEADLALCIEAQENARALGLMHRTAFVCADYRHVRLGSFDVLYIYPDKPLAGLERKLTGWSGTLLVYGPHFSPKNWKPSQVFRWEKETLSLYAFTEPHGKDATDESP